MKIVYAAIRNSENLEIGVAAFRLSLIRLDLHTWFRESKRVMQHPVVLPATKDQFPKTWSALEKALVSQVAPGFVFGVWNFNQGFFQIGALGCRRLLPSPEPMEVNTVFDLASLTKVLATTPLCAALIERGWLRWDTALSSIIPEVSDSPIQIQHLLSHTAGYEAWKPLFEGIRSYFAPRNLKKVPIQERQKKMRELVLAEKPLQHPGQQCIYSDLGFLILGFALEEVTGMPLDRAVRKFVWSPLEISGARFFRMKEGLRFFARKLRRKFAATEDSPWRGGILRGEVHDENCWAMGGYAGHAGMFGRAQDVLSMVHGMWSGFFARETLRAFATPVSHPPGCPRTLGWDTPSGENPAVGKSFSKKTIGHLGYAGTSLWIDLEVGLAVTLLSNRVHPSAQNEQIRAFRPIFHQALREDLGY